MSLRHLIPLQGFTLAELLISLAILSVMATFTIPKILVAQQCQQYNAATKEAASIIAAAFDAYKRDNTVSTSTRFADMTSYVNYISIDTSSTIDDKTTLTSLSCNVSSGGCLVLHNGGLLRYNGMPFAGTASTNAIELYYDPNGTYGGTTNGVDKSVQIFLYYNGRISTRGTSAPNTVASTFTYVSPNSAYDPSWFSWN